MTLAHRRAITAEGSAGRRTAAGKAPSRKGLTKDGQIGPQPSGEESTFLAVEEDELWGPEDAYERPPPSDPREADAAQVLEQMFDAERRRVFFSRQLEVQHEHTFFHWVTNRALRSLAARGVIGSETRELPNKQRIHLMWHRSHRYRQKDSRQLMQLVGEYVNPNVSAVIGLNAERMVLDGFTSHGFVVRGRETRTLGDLTWEQTDHNLDFIFERDGVVYGTEVKNRLGYMDQRELKAKMAMCSHLGIRPLFVSRMFPKTWTYDLYKAGGFGLILRHQLYPISHKELAKRVREELGLPVDTPRNLYEGTMNRVLKWHGGTV